MTGNDFALKVCPRLADDIMAERKRVVAVQNKERWYKIVGKDLFIPPTGYFRMVPSEVDKCVEAINAFSIAPPEGYQRDAGWDIPHKFVEWDELHKVVPVGTTIACDIECANVGWDNNPIIVVGHYVSEDGICYIVEFDNAEDKEDKEAAQKFYDRRDVTFVWHNGKFDVGRLSWHGVTPHIDEDTMLMHYACINEQKGTHGLKDLAPLYLQAPEWDKELDAFKKQQARRKGIKIKEFQYTDIPRDVLIPYLAMDCYATYKLLGVFRKLQREGSERIYKNLIRASNVYWRIEMRGMLADPEHINNLHIKLQDEYDIAADEIEIAVKKIWDPIAYVYDTGARSLPREFNLKSPAQLKWLLHKATGEEITNTTAETLEDLYKAHPDLEFLNALKKFRKIVKNLDTYVSGMREAICKDGRIRASFNLHGTTTGRLSSSSPNMQNIPRDPMIKNIFIAEDGYKLVQFDYSQAELRMLAYLTQDEWLRQVYIDERDLHTEVAIAMFGENYTKDQRVRAKALNFGIAYGRGATSLRDEYNIPMAEAISLVQNWFQRMPKVKKWVDYRRLMPIQGIPYSTPLGRSRHYIITDSNKHGVQNESINFPVSSLASDMTLLSLCDIDDWIAKENLRDKVRIVNTVHDSIILEVLDDEKLIERVSAKGCEIMAVQPTKQLEDMNIPFVADVEVGYKWGDLS